MFSLFLTLLCCIVRAMLSFPPITSYHPHLYILYLYNSQIITFTFLANIKAVDIVLPIVIN